MSSIFLTLSDIFPVQRPWEDLEWTALHDGRVDDYVDDVIHWFNDDVFRTAYKAKPYNLKNLH